MSDAPDRPAPLILNVNDNEGARYLVTLMLQRGGFRVIEAETGLSALEKVRHWRPELAILDLKLPDISGFEVCRRIREDPEIASTKLLHTSATYVSVDNKIQSLEGGSDGYLAQPFEAQELIAMVQALLRLSHAEQELRRDAEQLREADRRKNEFLSMLAHELRNPLAAISAALPVIGRRAAADEVELRARDVLQRQSAHLGRLIDDLLDVARVTQGKIELKWEVVDLTALLQRVAENALRISTGPRCQKFEVRLADGPLNVRGDTTRLEQVFTNLLDNASKYTDPGGQIELSSSQLGGVARVNVRDTGIGMCAATIPTIFGLFSQADVPIARSRGGLGIGLTLVRTLVDLHGGSVSARSEGLGEGSEFEVTLPLINATEQSAERRQASARAAPRATVKRHVLLVEDNLDAQRMLADLMEIWGHQISCAADGLSGVASALELLPDVALVDIGLPGIDGYEVARRIRQHAHGRDLALIALTGYGAPEQQTRSREAGFDLHLVKPVDATRLEALLEDPSVVYESKRSKVAARR